MIHCPNCQTPNRPEAKFCLTCGTRLQPPVQFPEAESVTVVEPVSTEQPLPEADAVAAPAHGTPGSDVASPPGPPLMSAEPVFAQPTAETPAVALPAPVPTNIDAIAPVEPVEPVAVDTEPPMDIPSEPVAEPPAALSTVPMPADFPQPLAAGVLVAERFMIIAVGEEDATGRVYTATDQGVCNQCGAMIVPGDQFCGACGVELTGQPTVQVRESWEAPGPATQAVQHGDRWYAVLAAPAAAPAAEPPRSKTGWRFQVGQASHPGKIRDLDEDSVFTFTLSGIYDSQIAPTVGLYIVADGIGGHQGGEVASKLAVQTLSQQVLQRILWPIVQGEDPLPETLGELFGQAVQMASRQVYDLRRERASDMGTTLTAALVYNGLAIIANVGDSRTYVWGSDGLVQLTRDHSLIADLIAIGQEPPEAIYTHPQRNLIYRSLGDKPQVEVDLFSLELEPGFRLVLCCDGVWEMIRNEGIEEIMLKEEHPQRAADKIVQWANDAGGEDNISVVVVNVEHV